MSSNVLVIEKSEITTLLHSFKLFTHILVMEIGHYVFFNGIRFYKKFKLSGIKTVDKMYLRLVNCISSVSLKYFIRATTRIVIPDFVKTRGTINIE